MQPSFHFPKHFLFTCLLLLPCLHCRLLLHRSTEAAADNKLISDNKLVPVQVFDGESFFYYPRPPSSQVEVPLSLKKDAAVNMLVKVSIILAESFYCCVTKKGWGCPGAP